MEIDQKPSEKDVREFCKSRTPLYMVPRTLKSFPRHPPARFRSFCLGGLENSDLYNTYNLYGIVMQKVRLPNHYGSDEKLLVPFSSS